MLKTEGLSNGLGANRSTNASKLLLASYLTSIRCPVCTVSGASLHSCTKYDWGFFSSPFCFEIYLLLGWGQAAENTIIRLL